MYIQARTYGLVRPIIQLHILMHGCYNTIISNAIYHTKSVMKLY